MFIEHDDRDKLPRSLGAKHLVAEEDSSLLRTEEVLFSSLAINISRLCGEAGLLFSTLEILAGMQNQAKPRAFGLLAWLHSMTSAEFAALLAGESLSF